MKKVFWKNYGLTATGVLAGAVAGYIYWYYWGCEEGCTIRSVWWRMSLWGALMGGLLFSALGDHFKRQTSKD